MPSADNYTSRAQNATSVKLYFVSWQLKIIAAVMEPQPSKLFNLLFDP